MTLDIFLILLSISVTANATHTLISAEDVNGTTLIVTISGDPTQWKNSAEDPDFLVYVDLDILGKTDKLGMHFSENLIFGDRAIHGRIDLYRFQPSGLKYFDTVTGTTNQVGGISVDWVNNKVYWTDETVGWIVAASIYDTDGRGFSVIMSDLDTPAGIAVHPGTRQIFWTDCGVIPKIERSSIEGDHRVKIVSSNRVSSPKFLNIDYHTDTLYWVDTGRNEINICDLDGNNIKVILKEDFIGFFVGFTLFNGEQEDLIIGLSDIGKELYMINPAMPQDYSNMSLEFLHGDGFDCLHDIQIFAASAQPAFGTISGDESQTDTSQKNTIIIGVTVSSALVIAVVIVVICYIKARSSLHPNDQTFQDHSLSSDNHFQPRVFMSARNRPIATIYNTIDDVVYDVPRHGEIYGNFPRAYRGIPLGQSVPKGPGGYGRNTGWKREYLSIVSPEQALADGYLTTGRIQDLTGEGDYYLKPISSH